MGDGRRRRFYGRTRAEMAERLRRAQTALAQGLPLADERITVGAFLRRWLAESAQPALRPRTFQGYETNVERHLIPALGRVRLARLTPDAVQALLNRKVADGLSPSTVRGIHATLRRALTQAERWGWSPETSRSWSARPPAKRPEVRPFMKEQVRRFLDAVHGDRFEPLYHATSPSRSGCGRARRWA